MNIATISSKNQITLPVELLLGLSLRPYDKVLVEQEKKTIVLKPISGSIVSELGGSLNKFTKAEKLGVSFEEIMKETKKKTAKRLLE